jgi:hypothetical protein
MFDGSTTAGIPGKPVGRVLVGKVLVVLVVDEVVVDAPGAVTGV